ncbi:hypothetical protein ACWDKQ_24755 [Saccharopolyspora sp. NPDC000995]
MSEPQRGDEEHEPTTLQGAESLDADQLGSDPVERGVELPEHWSAETRSRPTPRAEREGESLDEHLAEEVPDERASTTSTRPPTSGLRARKSSEAACVTRQPPG